MINFQPRAAPRAVRDSRTNVTGGTLLKSANTEPISDGVVPAPSTADARAALCPSRSLPLSNVSRGLRCSRVDKNSVSRRGSIRRSSQPPSTTSNPPFARQLSTSTATHSFPEKLEYPRRKALRLSPSVLSRSPAETFDKNCFESIERARRKKRKPARREPRGRRIDSRYLGESRTRSATRRSASLDDAGEIASGSGIEPRSADTFVVALVKWRRLPRGLHQTREGG